METGLRDKVVVVTGATANIGRATALAFAEEGARVVLVGRDEQAGARVAELAGERGAADVLWQRADVTVAAEVSGLVDAVLACFGSIDVLVNNVGGNAVVAPFVSTTPAQWQADLDVNLTSTLLCTHAVLPHMLAAGAGRIVNIGSMSALIGDPFMAVYSAAKGAVHAFTRVLALEVGRSGVTVNAIAPYGTVPEDFAAETSAGSRFRPGTGLFTDAEASRAEERAVFRRSTALARQVARPAEIGAAAVYLASEQAAFVTGHVLQVDGGVGLT
ncbi:SDR family NAD(P)-dependent oxidoreductase [Nocardia sp. alder85J]|uniref:SDR family NAD(P)-dependent oxidoreductase n=1 Tax=Nocardia sp. alder85J TaxID=2862949 RepID=UPI001CD55111|nr:SDR family NAD(P)-dependent oxidoreductase [Nocardia sp. alder85J]MCX4094596.1 SDR family NAD(P)-dependent oxidoreductase [Nocardia sp. alder85J]